MTVINTITNQCDVLIHLMLVVPAGSLSCLSVLLDHGAEVDCLDVKCQTPLFVALINQHWECGRRLLVSNTN